MKHCPNPECGGLAKFKIVSEYNDSDTLCADCQAALVPGPGPNPDDLVGRPEPTPDVELVPLMEVRDQSQLILIEEALDLAQIPYMAKGERIQDLFGFGRATIVNPISGPIVIFVTSTDAEVAREVVEAFLG